MADKKKPTTSAIASYLMKTYKSISYSVAMHVASDIIMHRNGYNMELKTALKTAEYLVKKYTKDISTSKQKISKSKRRAYEKKNKRASHIKKKRYKSDIHEFLIWVDEQQEKEMGVDKAEDKEYEAGKIVAAWLEAIEQAYTKDESEYAMQNRDLIYEIIARAKAEKETNYFIYTTVKKLWPDAEERLEKLANSIYDNDYKRDAKNGKLKFKRDVDRLIKALNIRTGIRNKWW